jgi:hypothetical protein
MLSPLVVQDIINDKNDAVSLMKEKTESEIYAANLSASMEGNESDGICLSSTDMAEACSTLLKKGAL